MQTKQDTITEDSIKTLVDRFYEKVRSEEGLNKVFLDAIGSDTESWRPHLQKMYDFWSSVMLSSGRFHGTPMQKHIALPRFEPELFDTWLVLFAETANEIHTEKPANAYIEKSKMIAESLKLGIFYRNKA